jgi:hypothetical protein
MYSGTGILPGKTELINKLYDKYIVNDKTRIWKNMLSIIVDPNNSDTIFQMKSMFKDNLINIPQVYMDRLLVLSGGLLDPNGILKYLDKIELYIGEELIDTLGNEMYQIIKSFFVNLNKSPGLLEMLGIPLDNYVNGMMPWIYNVIGGKNLYIPLYYFFNEYMNSIPMISCMYSDINLKLTMNNTTMIKDFYTVTKISIGQDTIKSSILADYILLEREERKKLSTEIQDNLIERHQTYSVDKKITIFDSDPNFITVNFDFNIQSVVKELFWTLNFYINDFELNDNPNTLSTDSQVNSPYKNINDLVLSTIFYIDGNRRDGINPITGNDYNKITTLINSYKYNTKNLLNTKFNVYSFALYPEKLQPTGAFNMKVINKFTIQLVLDKQKYLQYFKSVGNTTNLDTVTIQMNLQTIEYNILRYQAGIAGLLFIS